MLKIVFSSKQEHGTGVNFMKSNMEAKIENLYSNIEQSLFGFYPNLKYGRHTELYINEIIARLFVKVYGLYPTTNINEYLTEQSLHNDGINSTDENIIKMMRRKEKESLNAINKLITTLNSEGHNICLNQTSRNSGEKSIPKDKANLIMVDTMLMHPFEDVKNSDGTFRKKQVDAFIDIIKKDTSSNNLPSSNIESAFKQIDDFYEETKKLNNKKEYIDRWVNFHRMETRLSVSLINEIADYMIYNDIKEFPSEIFKIAFCWQTVKFNHFSGQDIYEPIAILRYNKYIQNYFSDKFTEEQKDNLFFTRMKQAALVDIHYDFAKKVFHSYFNDKNNENDVEAIYDFCRTKYPIIDLHTTYNFKFENPSLYTKKIQSLRSILKIFFPPDKIKKYYQN